MKPRGTQNTPRPDHPESIFGLNNLFQMTTVSFCALQSPVTYIYICNHALNWNVFKNRYLSTLTLHCWFAQQSRISLTRENITKTHAIDKHTLADGEFVIKHTLADGEFAINTCLLWWRSNQLTTMYDDVTSEFMLKTRTNIVNGKWKCFPLNEFDFWAFTSFWLTAYLSWFCFWCTCILNI